jgi:hypothetical protein
MKGVLYGSGVLWNDPPVICDSAYINRTNRFREVISNPEGECIQYDVTYELVRAFYGRYKFGKFTSGRVWRDSVWEFFSRNTLIDNLQEIIDEDKQLEWL